MALTDPHPVDHLRHAADRIPPASAEGVVAQVRHRRDRRHRRRRTLQATGAVALVLVAGAVAVVAPGVGDDSTVEVRAADETTTVPPATADCGSMPGPATTTVDYAGVQDLLARRATELEDRFGAVLARAAGDPVRSPRIEVVVPSARDCPTGPVSVGGVPVTFSVYGADSTDLVGAVDDVEVVNEGPLPDGRRWRQVTYVTEEHGRCVDLVTPRSGGGGCGAEPDPLNLGQSWTRGYPRFLDGVTTPEVATVALHLSSGEVVEVTPTDMGHEVNYVVFAVPDGVEVIDVDALDAAGVSMPLGEGADRFTTDEEDRAEVEAVFLQWLSSRGEVEPVVAAVDGGEALRPTITEAIDTAPSPAETYSGVVDGVELVGDDRAVVSFRIVTDSGNTVADQVGDAVRVDGRWLVSRDAYCTALAIGPLRCPPE